MLPPPGLGEDLESERNAKSALEKSFRNKEAELKETNAKLEEVMTSKAALETEFKKRDAELATVSSQLDEEQEAGAKKDRTIKDLENKIHDLEEELEVKYLCNISFWEFLNTLVLRNR